MKLKYFFKNTKTQLVLVLILCASIAFSKTILSNNKATKNVASNTTKSVASNPKVEAKTKTPKPTKTSVTYATDSDLDGVTDDIDLDDDNDGILDTVECPATNVVTNGTFNTDLSGWTAGANWVFSGGAATNTIGSSSLSQSLNNLDKVPNNTVSITVKIGAQDAGAAGGNTSSLDIMLGGVVYATLSNSTARNTSNVTISLASGVTSNFVIFGTSGSATYTTSTFTVNIPYTGPSSATLAFRMNTGTDDWSVDDVSISALICDLDGDGIPNYLDLDSDGDGCTDAIEGGAPFTNANLQPATGSIATQNPSQNLGNSVGSNGVPTIAGAGQSVGNSQNSSILDCQIDSDGDGVIDICDLDDDNDGITDIQENSCALQGQQIRVGYIPNSRDTDSDNGYTFDGTYMSGSGKLKLENLANFGPSGTVNATFVLVPMTGTITKASIVALDLNAIFLGGIDNGSTSYLSNSELTAIKDWSDDSTKNYVVSTQFQTPAWGAAIVSGNTNPDVPTTLGNTTPIFNGPFGAVTSFNQGGGFQANFTPDGFCSTQILAQDSNSTPKGVMYIDGTYNDLMVADVDIFTTIGGISAGNAVSNNNDRLFMNIWAFIAQQSSCLSDADGDGIINSLDLDSDGDSCPDAIEGGGTFTFADMVTATGALANQSPNKNLGNNVGNTPPTRGIPNAAVNGQSVGYSKNSAVSECIDSDNDGVIDGLDLDDDNDGILDTDEGLCATTSSASTDGFDSPVVPNINANNLQATNPYNGWTAVDPSTGTLMPSNTFNIIRVNGSNYTLGPNLAQSGNQYLDTAGAATIYKQFTFTTPTVVNASAYFANRATSDALYVPFTIGIEIINTTTNAVVQGNVLSFTKAMGDEGWYQSSIPNTALPAGTYRVRMTLSDFAHVDSIAYCFSTDTDGDSIPNYLDLDSDGDGCTDAIEGGANFTNSNLVTATGVLATQTPNQNLGNNVGSNGVPTIAGTGQSVGDSNNAAVNGCYCYKTPASPGGGNPNPVKHGITALNRAGSGVSDWPGVRRSAWTVLEAKSKGFVVNRMAFVDADSNPATPTTPPLASIPAANYVEGMMVYDTVANCLKIYNGTVWNCYTSQTCPDL